MIEAHNQQLKQHSTPTTGQQEEAGILTPAIGAPHFSSSAGRAPGWVKRGQTYDGSPIGAASRSLGARPRSSSAARRGGGKAGGAPTREQLKAETLRQVERAHGLRRQSTVNSTVHEYPDQASSTPSRHNRKRSSVASTVQSLASASASRAGRRGSLQARAGARPSDFSLVTPAGTVTGSVLGRPPLLGEPGTYRHTPTTASPVRVNLPNALNRSDDSHAGRPGSGSLDLGLPEGR